MAFIDLGKLKFNWQGVWSAVTNYEVDDVVFYDNHSFVCTVTHTATASAPSANLTNWDLMTAGVHFREDGDWSGSNTYYRYDIVRHNSNLYLLSGANESTNQTPGSAPWSLFQAAPAGNVMNSIGAMEYRNNENATSELVINPTVNKGLTVQEQPKETYPGRAFTYEEDGSYGKAFSTAGSIPAQSYTQTVTVQRGAGNFTDGSYVITGGDRNGGINKKHDPNITINIGDTIVFNNGTGAHPLEITTAQGQGQPSVSTGTYTGEGTATVTWVTTGVAAGTYYYQCQTAGHTGMVGTITVVDTTNTQGSSTGNGTIDVCRGKTYTITFAGNLSNGQNYDLYTTAGGHSTANFSVTAAEGNSAFTSTSSSGVVWTTGSTQTITFTPNETTPDVVYVGNRNSAMSNNLIINVNDVAYVPSWGTSSYSAPGALDQREFIYWQQWYGGECNDQSSGVYSSYGITLPTSTRDPGSDVKVNGNAVGAQQQRLSRADSGGATVDWTVPDGVEKVRITCIGGGGGGGSYTGHYYGGCGGGGGSFASGEYTVAEGDTLRIVAGHGGFGGYGQTGGTGGTTTVQDVDGGTVGAKVNLSAEGGHGGNWAQGYGDGGDEVTVSGSSLLAGNQYKYAGGNGGRGAWNYNSYGNDGHVSGGGGSAGSMYGHGFRGGEGRAYQTGFHCAHSGGGGIGGAGGHGVAAYRGDDHGPCAGGGGGGSAGPGQNGNRSPVDGDVSNYFPWGPSGGDGGAGLADGVHVAGYIDIMPEVHGRSGAKGSSRNELDGETDVEHDGYMIQMSGARYGDGEQAHPTAGWDVDALTLSRGPYTRVQQNNFGARPTNTEIEYKAKSWNGVLGRLWGGGGAGGGDTHANTAHMQSNGGEGGSGGGGGGATQYQYYGGPSSNVQYGKEMFAWDWANMAWRWTNKHRIGSAPGLVTTGTDYDYSRSAYGGHGGALGGGGASGNYGCEGGYGGIGGGGGGGSNTYNPPYPGSGGHGGVGYVLIEWGK